MKNKILMFVVTQLLDMLKPKDLKKAVDYILDFFEDKVAETETDIDDRIALPLIALLRKTFDIPDDD